MPSVQKPNKLGIRLSGRRGQRLIIDGNILTKIVEYAKLDRNDVVFEIGTGLGNLTALLAPKVKRVITVESDRRLLNLAKEKVGYKNIDFILGDVLKIDWPEFNKVVANIPYQISSKLMYQREFAKRLIATPGSDAYGRLTINFYFRASAEILEEVPPEAFFPPPRVSSAVVRILPRAPPFKVLDEKLFFQTVASLFQHRRQLVRNALYHSYHIVFPNEKVGKIEKRKIVDQILAKKLAETRVIDLTPEQVGEISNLLAQSRI